ncbi:putative uncharacterized protein SPANXA2-OT1 [Plecturocebus cupreus]
MAWQADSTCSVLRDADPRGWLAPDWVKQWEAQAGVAPPGSLLNDQPDWNALYGTLFFNVLHSCGCKEEEKALVGKSAPENGASLLLPVWSAMARSRLIATSASRVQAILLPQTPE